MNEIQIEDAWKGIVSALQELRKVTQEMRQIQNDLHYSLGKVVNDSHLRSMLTLQKEDIGFRRMLDLNR